MDISDLVVENGLVCELRGQTAKRFVEVCAIIAGYRYNRFA